MIIDQSSPSRTPCGPSPVEGGGRFRENFHFSVQFLIPFVSMPSGDSSRDAHRSAVGSQPNGVLTHPGPCRSRGSLDFLPREPRFHHSQRREEYGATDSAVARERSDGAGSAVGSVPHAVRKEKCNASVNSTETILFALARSRNETLSHRRARYAAVWPFRDDRLFFCSKLI